MVTFDIVAQGDDYVVIATDTGHPITGPRTRRSAAATAAILNQAAAAGPSALRKALGAAEDSEPWIVGVRF